MSQAASFLKNEKNMEAVCCHTASSGDGRVPSIQFTNGIAYYAVSDSVAAGVLAVMQLLLI